VANETILVVEDEACIGLEVSSVLKEKGYRIPPIVKYGDDVVGRVMSDKPDLLLCDIRLGGFLDGIEAVERLRLVQSSLPIIYITAYGDAAIRRRASKTRPLDILDKPVSHEKLLKVVEDALSSN
jgi:DNA-binding NtrC family response regulator